MLSDSAGLIDIWNETDCERKRCRSRRSIASITESSLSGLLNSPKIRASPERTFSSLYSKGDSIEGVGCIILATIFSESYKREINMIRGSLSQEYNITSKDSGIQIRLSILSDSSQ